MQPTTHSVHRVSMQPCAILATVAGTLVLAAVTGLKLGAVPSLPAKIVLGLSLAVFYGAMVGAMRPVSRPAPAARRGRRRPDDPIIANHDPRAEPVEAERARAWRRARLAALGVSDATALVLAEDPSFSIHELKQLLAQGCPLDTALRILWPA